LLNLKKKTRWQFNMTCSGVYPKGGILCIKTSSLGYINIYNLKKYFMIIRVITKCVTSAISGIRRGMSRRYDTSLISLKHGLRRYLLRPWLKVFFQIGNNSINVTYCLLIKLSVQNELLLRFIPKNIHKYK